MIAINTLDFRDMTFLSMAKKYGIWRFFLSTEAVSPLVILALGKLAHILPLSTQVEKDFLPVVIGASASVFAVEITGFAILASLSDKEFLAMLWKKMSLTDILFPFLWCSLAWITSIMLSLLQYILSLDVNRHTYTTTGQFLSLGFFSYSLLLTYRLLLTVLRFGIVRAFFSFKGKISVKRGGRMRSSRFAGMTQRRHR